MACVAKKLSVGRGGVHLSNSVKRHVLRHHQQRVIILRSLPGSADAFVGDVERWEKRQGQDVKSADGTGAEVESLKKRIKAVEERIIFIEGEMHQLTDQVRIRDISLLEAVNKRQEVQLGNLEQTALSIQAEAGSEADLDEVMAGFTEVLSKGYLEAVQRLRDRLLVTEWELSIKPLAMRRGVAAFEKDLADKRLQIDYEAISALYDDPTNLEAIVDPHLRLRARACINQCMIAEQLRVYRTCTDKAEDLAKEFSHGELISKVLPEGGVLSALKSVAGPAVKAVLPGN